MTEFVELKRLYYKTPSKVIFDHIDLHFLKGKITVVMGPSGTGKTTLLRLLTGQIRPHGGDVLVAGKSIPGMNLKELYQARRCMSMLFQAGALFTDLNVFDNVAFPLREHTNLSEAMIRDIVLMKLQAVGLRGAFALKTSELSGGMARRVALARAIALDPKLMLYDEPFTGQDPISRGVLIKLIRSLNDAFNMTSIVVTHDINEAKQLGDRLVLLSGGKVIGEGTPQELIESEIPAVRQFIHALPDGEVPFQHPACDYREDLHL